jgi:hypothetical protein
VAGIQSLCTLDWTKAQSKRTKGPYRSPIVLNRVNFILVESKKLLFAFREAMPDARAALHKCRQRVTGLGVADDLQSLMVFNDTDSIGGNHSFVTRLLLCEDM